MKAGSLIAAVAALGLGAWCPAAGDGQVDYALPIVGTDNTVELSAGNLYPCIARPHLYRVYLAACSAPHPLQL